MTTIRSRWTRPAGVLLLLVAAAVGVQACGIEAPPSPTAPVIGERGAQVTQMVADTPSFTPFRIAPQLSNRVEVGQALEANYTPALREAGVTGRAEVWIRITDQGVVDRTSIHKSSGTAALDDAALAVAHVMKFKPAQYREQPVTVWVSIPITFQQRPPASPAAATDIARQQGQAIPVTGTKPDSAARGVAAGKGDIPWSSNTLLEGGRKFLADGYVEEAVKTFKSAVLAGADGDAIARELYRDGMVRGVRPEDWSHALGSITAAKSFATSAELRAQLDFWHGWALYHAAIALERPQSAQSAAVVLPMFQQAEALFQAGAGYARRAPGIELDKILSAVTKYEEVESAILRR